MIPSERQVPEPIKIEATSAKAAYRLDRATKQWVVYDEGSPEGYSFEPDAKSAQKTARFANRGGAFYGWTPPFFNVSVQPLIEKVAAENLASNV